MIIQVKASWKQTSSLFQQVYLFPDMILYISDPKDTTKNLLELINTFRKVSRHEINTQKLLSFLYTHDKHSKKEIKETTLFTIDAQKYCVQI